jgi:hypothetical protein
MENETAYLLTYNGLGDYITMIGALNFLSNHYKHIYMLCRKSSIENMKLFLPDKPITYIPIQPTGYGLQEYEHFEAESNECIKIINEVPINNDVLICGSKQVKGGAVKPRITNKRLLEYKSNDKQYTVKWVHIQEFYHNINLDLSIYYEYFDIPSVSTPISNITEEYNIIFAHTKASDCEIQIPDVIAKYTDDENTIIICANKNVYPTNHPKYELANKYINIPIAHYIDIIKQATEIHVVDSCFSCIVYPLQQTNRLSAKTVTIYERTPQPQPQPKKSYKMRMQF